MKDPLTQLRNYILIITFPKYYKQNILNTSITHDVRATPGPSFKPFPGRHIVHLGKTDPTGSSRVRIKVDTDS